MAAKKSIKTSKSIEALRPEAKPYDVGDGTGLRLRVQATKPGEPMRRVFRWIYRGANGKQVVVTIGEWAPSEQHGRVTLAQARKWLADLKAANDEGPGAVAAVRAAIKASLTPKPEIVPVRSSIEKTLADAFADFYASEIEGARKRPKSVLRRFKQYVGSMIGSRPLKSIAALDVAPLIKSLVNAGRHSTADKALQEMKQFFEWAVTMGILDRSPVAPLKARRLGIIKNERPRVLAAREIPIFWNALDVDHTVAPATAAALRFLLLVPVRSGELIAAEWSEIDFDAGTWTIPVEHSKYSKEKAAKAKPFVVPLPPMAIDLLRDIQAQAGEGARYVLQSQTSHNGRYNPCALNLGLTRLQEAGVMKFPGVFPKNKLNVHDLRRTCRTGLADLGVPFDIAEGCLNHELPRIQRTYQRSDLVPQRREALERWAGFVAGLINPQIATVTPLAAAG